MELLYFIGGILSVGVLYGVRLLRTIKSSHTDLEAKYQSQSNISSIRNADLVSRLDDLENLTTDVQKQMEEDQYKNLSKINKRVDDLMNLAVENRDKAAGRDLSVNKDISKAFSEIQQIKAILKGMNEGEYLSRY